LDKSKVVPGTYTTDWLVLSKQDGHITKGSYVFSVENSNVQNHHHQEKENVVLLHNDDDDVLRTSQ
jgi:hypothetical protein